MKRFWLPAAVAAAALACAPQTPGPGAAGGEPPPQDFITGGAWGQGQEPKRGGVAVFAHREDPPSGWDPLVGGTINLGQVASPMTGDGNLLKPCREDVDKVCLGLAERWEASADHSQFVFKIRDSVRWHDGVGFTAEDAKFWLDLAYFGMTVGDKRRGPSRLRATMGDIKGTEVLEGNRVRVTLNGPEPLWPTMLAQLNVGVVAGTIWHPKHLTMPLFEQGTMNVAPQDIGFVGLGPYKMEKFEKGSLISVRRFDGYWEKDEKGRQLPHLDGVEYPIIRDPTAMDAAFRTGRIDLTARGTGHYFNAERYEPMKAALGDKVWFGQIEGALHTLTFNQTRPGPLQDVRVRKAILLWFDKQAFTDAIHGGPCCGMLHPGVSPESIWPNPDWKSWPGFNPVTRQRDRDEAKRLMREAGYAEGVEVPYMCRRQWISTVCEWVVGDLAGLGVRLTLDLVDDAEWRRRELAGEHFMQNFSGWSFNASIGPEVHEGQIGRASLHPSSVLKHEDQKIDEFYRRLRAASGNLDERVKVWRELERYLVLEQVFGVPGWGELALVAGRSYVKGMHIPKRNRANNLDMATVWLDK